jgi:hypothetical protein
MMHLWRPVAVLVNCSQIDSFDAEFSSFYFPLAPDLLSLHPDYSYQGDKRALVFTVVQGRLLK